MEEHLRHVRILFERLHQADLKLTKRKCNFLKAHVQYLGHYISGQGLEPIPEKLQSLQEMPPPTDLTETRKFLGFVGYYRKFIPKYSDIARPLTNLTRKDIPFEWSKACQAAFEMLKEYLLKEPILKYPKPDPTICIIHRCKQICLGWRAHPSLCVQRRGKGIFHSSPYHLC